MAEGTGAVAATGAEGAVTTGATGGVATGVAGAATGAPATWYGGFGLDADTVGTLQNQGWDKLEGVDKAFPEVLKAFKETHRLVGLDKLPMPKDLNDKDGYARVYDRLGRPKTAAEYGLKPAEGGDPAFAATMSEAFHSMGLSKQQVDGIVSKYGEQALALKAAEDAAYTRNTAAELDMFRKELGPQYDASMAAAQRFTVAFGIDGPMAEKIEKAIGTKAMLGLFSKIGQGLTEDRGAGAGGGSGGFMTPEAAQSRLNDLKADEGWRGRYLANGMSERAEYDKLIAIVAGG